MYRPTTGQTALMMSAFSGDSSVADGTHALLNFYRNITEDDGYAAIKGMLENPNIPDSLEQLMDLTEAVIEEFTGNPTKQPTDYLPSRQTGGRNLTATRRRPGQTPSRSRRVGSATGSTRTSSDD